MIGPSSPEIPNLVRLEAAYREALRQRSHVALGRVNVRLYDLADALVTEAAHALRDALPEDAKTHYIYLGGRWYFRDGRGMDDRSALCTPPDGTRWEIPKHVYVMHGMMKH